MPGLLDTLKSVGFLAPLGKDFSDFADELNREKEQGVFNELLGNAVEHIKNNFTTSPGVTLSSTTTIPRVSSLDGLMPKSTPEKISMGQPNLGPTKLSLGTPTPGQDITTKLPTQTYAELSPIEQKRKNQEQIANILLRSPEFKDMDPNVIKNALAGLQGLAGATETPIPEYKYEHFGPKDTIIRTNTATGETTEIQKGKEPIKYTAEKNYVAQKDYPEFGVKKGQQIAGRYVENDDGSLGEFQPMGKPGYKPSTKTTEPPIPEPYKGYSKDFQFAQTGLETVKALRQQIYNANNAPKTSMATGTAGKKVIDVTKDGKMEQMTPEAATAYKNQLVAKYRPGAEKILKNLKIDGFVKKIFDYAKQKGITKVQAAQAYIEANDWLDDDQKQAIQIYAELSDQ